VKSTQQASDAVGGLSEVLLALGDELRKANRKVGEMPYGPVLFLSGATVELNLSFSASAEAGVQVWVVEAKGQRAKEHSATITVHLNTTGEPEYGVGK